ncbi:MAG: PQQ-binding-like beta-propeller repeat protein, partial [Candidatus Pacebacteria bacterium]|nr:PQQ-binding-like beta-propeller repeat protein [Candidatus Paceibacterota bacterium]
MIMKKVLVILVILIIITGAGYFVWQKVKTETNLIKPIILNETTKEEQPVSNHPWSQFHGNYFHTGYADVKGSEKATLKWKFKIGKIEGAEPSSIAISSDGTIYVAGAGKIFALDKSGKEIWSKNYQNTQGPALSEDGSIYFLSRDTIVALDKDGNEKWKYKTNGNTIIGLTIGPDGTIYQGSWDGYFYAIDKDGKLKWKYKTEGAISYPASIDQNGIIYLGGGDAHAGPDSNLYAFNLDGTLKWKYDTKAVRVGSPAIGSDGLIYIPAGPNLIVLDSSGNLKWKKGPEVSFNGSQVVSAAECGAPPLPACNGVQPQNGNMPQSSAGCGAPPLPPCDSMNQPQNGNMPQSFPGKDDISGIITPAISSDGIIYIGNVQGVLSAISSKTQEVKWTYQTGAD